MSSKKIIIILVCAAAIVALFFVYKKIMNKSADLDNQTASSSVDIVKENDFKNALRDAVAVDRDLDGIADQDEATYKTNIDENDTDGDGLSDGQEVFIYGADPLKNDTDGDTFLDGYEVRRGFSPTGAGVL
jgi:hypothetical protein